ncbi:MAG: pro-sigmaK processing inhibitor BofA family protein [Lawsonibacter sp.]
MRPVTGASIPWLALGLLLLAGLALLRRPLGQLLRLAVRSSVGLAVLALFSQVSPLIGVSLGVNPVNALVLGALGAPGFGLLLMLQWALR